MVFKRMDESWRGMGGLKRPWSQMSESYIRAGECDGAARGVIDGVLVYQHCLF